MLRSIARIGTARADRYRDQLARHGAGMVRTVRDGGGTDGAGMVRTVRDRGGTGMPPIRDASAVDGVVVLELAWGRCTVTARQDELILLAEAPTVADLQKIQAGVGGRVTRIGRRDGLSVVWSTAEGDPSVEDLPRTPPARRSLMGAVALATILGVVVLLHLGIGAALLRRQWTWWALVVVGVVVVAKLLLARHFAASVRGHLHARRQRL